MFKSRKLWLGIGAVACLTALGLAIVPIAPKPSDASLTQAATSSGPAPESKQGVQPPDQPSATPPTASHQPKSDAQTPTTWGGQPLAPSLAGTEIDGRLRADSDGHLIVELETKDFFDYMLSAVGEISPEQALDAIATMARNNLPEPAASEAIALLDRYLAYKREALTLSQTPLDPARQHDPAYQISQLRQALADLKVLRRATLSPETADAFFGLEEAYGEYTLASMEIQQRDDLTMEAKQALIQWQRDQLPDIIRRTETQLVSDTEQSMARQEVLANAASPDEAAAELRNLGMAPAQAQEVENYLHERENFDQHYDAYKEELVQLRDAGLAAEDLAQREEALLAQHFKGEQQQTWARLRQLGDN